MEKSRFNNAASKSKSVGDIHFSFVKKPSNLFESMKGMMLGENYPLQQRPLQPRYGRQQPVSGYSEQQQVPRYSTGVSTTYAL